MSVAVPKNLAALSSKQLIDLERQIAAEVSRRFVALESAKADMQSQLGAKLTKVLAEMGLPPTAASLQITTPATSNGQHKAVKAKPRKARKPIIAVKYRNPDNTSETWSGRGRPARWLTAAMAKTGKGKEAFAVR